MITIAGSAHLVQCTTIKDTRSSSKNEQFATSQSEEISSQSSDEETSELSSKQTLDNVTTRIRKMGISHQAPLDNQREEIEEIPRGRRKGRCEKQKEVIVRITTWTCQPTFVEEDGTYTVDLRTRTLDLMVQGHPQIALPPQHVNVQRRNKMTDVLQNQAMAVIKPTVDDFIQLRTSVADSSEKETTYSNEMDKSM